MPRKGSYYPSSLNKSQTELDLSSVKSDAPARLRNTDVYIGNDKNRELTEHGLAIMSWDTIDVNDPQQLQNRISQYFGFCVDHNAKPSVAGLALAINLSKETIFRMVRGDITTDRKYSADTVSLIRRVYMLFDSLWMDYMQNGQINPASGIFLGKNLFGYRDVVDYTLTPGTSASAPDPAELNAKYAALPDNDDQEISSNDADV